VLTVPLTDVKSADICVSWTSEAVKKKPKNGSEASSIAGRPLLLADPRAEELSFMVGDEIPPPLPVHFPASEPYTILGIDPETPHDAVASIASARAGAWLKVLAYHAEYERERASITAALQILGQRQTIFRYRSFIRTTYDPARTDVTPAKLQRAFAAAIISCAPELRRRQTLKDVQAGIGFGSSLLIAAVLLVGVVTVPIGGITLLGFPLFAKTALIAWGPIAILPALGVLSAGALAAYWYHQHADVFLQIHESLSEALQQIAALGAALDDVYLLRCFHLFERTPEEFHKQQRLAEQERNTVLEIFIGEFVRAFVDELVVSLSQVGLSTEMNSDELFQYLKDHPAEVRSCFKRVLYGTAVDPELKLLCLKSADGPHGIISVS
jgi:hypothetical protein